MSAWPFAPLLGGRQVVRAWPLLVFWVCLVLQGCASVAGPGQAANPAHAAHPADPWEAWNRPIFSLNDRLDEAVFKPVARAYVNVTPQLMRQGVSNFFGNFADAWSAVNGFLQGKGQVGVNNLMRVTTNTVFGVLGLFDVATEAGIERQGEDFGQTLGVWGVPPGPYLVWPVLGPSTLRETAALPLEVSFGPGTVIHDTGAQWGMAVLQVVDLRASLLSVSGLLDDVALDRYTFVRDAYLQRRRSLVYDGNPPDPADEAQTPIPPELPHQP